MKKFRFTNCWTQSKTINKTNTHQKVCDLRTLLVPPCVPPCGQHLASQMMHPVIPSGWGLGQRLLMWQLHYVLQNYIFRQIRSERYSIKQCKDKGNRQKTIRSFHKWSDYCKYDCLIHLHLQSRSRDIFTLLLWTRFFGNNFVIT